MSFENNPDAEGNCCKFLFSKKQAATILQSAHIHVLPLCSHCAATVKPQLPNSHGGQISSYTFDLRWNCEVARSSSPRELSPSASGFEARGAVEAEDDEADDDVKAAAVAS